MNLSLPHPDGDRPSSGEHAIFFLLHLPDWGRVSIEASMRGKGLYCRFTVSDPEVSTFSMMPFQNSGSFEPDRLPTCLLPRQPGKMVQTWLRNWERRETWLNIVVQGIQPTLRKMEDRRWRIEIEDRNMQFSIFNPLFKEVLLWIRKRKKHR
jgi:hypothetical protein